jgi:hypothetical protein
VTNQHKCIGPASKTGRWTASPTPKRATKRASSSSPISPSHISSANDDTEDEAHHFHFTLPPTKAMKMLHGKALATATPGSSIPDRSVRGTSRSRRKQSQTVDDNGEPEVFSRRARSDRSRSRSPQFRSATICSCGAGNYNPRRASAVQFIKDKLAQNPPALFDLIVFFHESHTRLNAKLKAKMNAMTTKFNQTHGEVKGHLVELRSRLDNLQEQTAETKAFAKHAANEKTCDDDYHEMREQLKLPWGDMATVDSVFDDSQMAKLFNLFVRRHIKATPSLTVNFVTEIFKEDFVGELYIFKPR